jgi:N-acetylneuraminate lyase
MGKLQGLVVATVTPMHEDGSRDLASLDAHVRDLLANGAEGLFVGGTTGQGLLLEEQERMAVLEASVKIAAARVPVPCRCALCGLTTAGAVRLAARMREHPHFGGPEVQSLRPGATGRVHPDGCTGIHRL